MLLPLGNRPSLKGNNVTLNFNMGVNQKYQEYL